MRALASQPKKRDMITAFVCPLLVFNGEARGRGRESCEKKSNIVQAP